MRLMSFPNRSHLVHPDDLLGLPRHPKGGLPPNCRIEPCLTAHGSYGNGALVRMFLSEYQTFLQLRAEPALMGHDGPEHQTPFRRQWRPNQHVLEAGGFGIGPEAPVATEPDFRARSFQPGHLVSDECPSGICKLGIRHADGHRQSDLHHDAGHQNRPKSMFQTTPTQNGNHQQDHRGQGRQQMPYCLEENAEDRNS